MLETRILEVFADSGLSKSEFAIKLGVSNAVMSHLSSGRNKASIDIILSILTHFPDISPDWLLLGIGNRYRSEVKQISPELKDKLILQLKHMRDAHQETLIRIQDLENQILNL
ncbi:MAG: helix-turn-helix transcriptional regulator [Bacteroidia bacterium]